MAQKTLVIENGLSVLMLENRGNQSLVLTRRFSRQKNR
jgi:hypothetical protein